jgi:hypothetical protein
MSDYRNQDYNDPNLDDPLRRDSALNPDARASNATWGWIAAAVFLVVVLAVAFGLGHQGNNTTNTASNDLTRRPPPRHRPRLRRRSRRRPMHQPRASKLA